MSDRAGPVLVVFAHPDPGSFNRAVLDEIVGALERAGRDVQVLDLYASGFRAAMTAEERVAYHTSEPIVDPQVAEHAAAVRRATTFVFVYPTWWSGLPAILKGWLERVMVPGVGFVFDERSGKVRPGLRHLRHIVGVSTYGSSWALTKVVNDNGKRTLSRTLRVSSGLRTRVTWMSLYGIDRSTDAERRRFLQRVGKAASRW